MRILLIAFVMALSACSAAPAIPIQASGQNAVTGFATAALWGTWEADLAPAYTRLAALRHRAARQLTDGRIDVATAIAIQQTADQARTLLDQSRRGNATTPSPEQRAQLAEAQRLIAVAEGALK